MSEPEASGQHSRRGQMTHLDTDVLAEFRAGLITGRRGAKIAAHLAGCDRCAALDDELAGVSALLASVPAPPMPDSVAQRLETVLAAEVARKNYAERGEVDRPGESGAPDRRPAKRGFRLATWRVLVPAGAVAVLAAGGFGLSQITRGPEGQTASSSAAGTAPASASAAAGSAAKGLSRVPVPSASTINGTALAPRRALPQAYLRVVTSHTDFTRARSSSSLSPRCAYRRARRTPRPPRREGAWRRWRVKPVWSGSTAPCSRASRPPSSWRARASTTPPGWRARAAQPPRVTCSTPSPCRSGISAP